MGDFLDFMKSNAGIATAANVASSGIGALMNWLSASSTNDRNERLMREQWDRELRMWKMNNAYNDPAAQMERLRRAGINPALAYANGVENVSASSADVGNAADMKAFQMPVNPIAIDPLAMSQAELMNAQADENSAQAAWYRSQLPLTEQQVEEVKQRIRESNQRIAESAAKINLMNEQQKHEEAKRLNIRFEQTMKSQEWRTMQKYWNSLARKNNAEADLSERQLKEMCETFIYRKTGLKLSNDLTEAKINESERMFEKLGVDINEAISRTDLNKQVYNTNKPLENINVDGADNALFQALELFFKLCSGVIHG